MNLGQVIGLDICAFLETRLGLKTIAGRLITAPGIKPTGLSQWQRDNFYLYGVVDQLRGFGSFLRANCNGRSV